MGNGKKALKLKFFCLILTVTFLFTSLIPGVIFKTEGVALAGQKPDNVILLIGDGMGFEQVEAYRDKQGWATPAGKKIYLDEVNDALGKMTTYSADSDITDSASAATAMSTGYKTINRMLGMTPDNDSFVPDEVPTILELAEQKGLATGLVATSQICHATPAGFAAHVTHRNQFNKIAAQYFDQFAAKNQSLEVLLGGEKRNFTPTGRPEYYNEAGKKINDDNDNRDLITEFKGKGYAVVENTASLKTAGTDKLLGLFTHKGGLTPEHKRAPDNVEPRLPEMTQKALEVLAKDPDGFLVMIEGSQIDWAGHDNNYEYLMGEMKAFDQAVKMALDFQKNNPDTLVIVTADHECGGLNYDLATGNFTWSSKDHTGVPVPVMAEGPGAQNFRGNMDNTDLARKIAAALNLTPPLVTQHTPVTLNQSTTFKVSSLGLPVAGAKISVIDAANNVLATLTTNIKGEASHIFNKEGNYTVKTSINGKELSLKLGSPIATAVLASTSTVKVKVPKSKKGNKGKNLFSKNIKIKNQTKKISA